MCEKFPTASLAYGTLGFTDPVNAVTSFAPPADVQTPQGAPYRAVSSMYPGAAAGASSVSRDTDDGAGQATDADAPASGRAHDATRTNVISNPNRPTNGPFATTSHGAYGTYPPLFPHFSRAISSHNRLMGDPGQLV